MSDSQSDHPVPTLSRGEIFIPDGADASAALGRTTHLAIGAHADDLELFAFPAIAACWRSEERHFTGITVTDGAGSSRTGPYAGFDDAAMVAVRRGEQRKAAVIGEYSAMIQLDHPSKVARDPEATVIVDELEALLAATRPRELFVHSPADKHDTHVAVFLRTVRALRRLPSSLYPERVIGYEGWRDLDWLCDDDKVVLPADRPANLAAALAAVYDSQISGGKRYDLAALGRRRAHATFFEPRAADDHDALCFGMDLTELVRDRTLTPTSLVKRLIDRFRSDALGRLRRLSGER